MRKILTQTAQRVSFYVAYFVGGAVIAEQLVRVAGLGERAESARSTAVDGLGMFLGRGLAAVLLGSAAFLVAGGLALGTSHFMKWARKKHDFAKEMPHAGDANELAALVPAWKTALTFVCGIALRIGTAIVAGACLLSSHQAIQDGFRTLGNEVHLLIAYAAPALAQVLGLAAVKVLLAVAAIETASKLYCWNVSKKHRPIFKRCMG